MQCRQGFLCLLGECVRASHRDRRLLCGGTGSPGARRGWGLRWIGLGWAAWYDVLLLVAVPDALDGLLLGSVGFLFWIFSSLSWTGSACRWERVFVGRETPES